MRRRDVWLAAAAYLAVALFATWPLATGLTRDVPWDLGDSLLNMWILSWDCEQLLAILRGDLGRIATFFDGNIFYPARLTLAYSEHLFPQAVQILPVYALTKNPILCYNLLFLSTSVLSGVGTFLLVREVTGNARAAFLGGLLFAFAPYRLPQSTHLQVLSAQWMPFAFYGFFRYLETRRRRALAGGALSLVLTALSCNYYLMFFVPFGGLFLLWEIGRRRRGHDRRLWLEVTTAAALSLLVLTPFVQPYIAARELFSMTRSAETLASFSADVYSYWTALSIQSFWGPVMQAFPRSEGELFPGGIPLLLGALGIGIWLADGWLAGRDIPHQRRGLTTALGLLLAGVAVLALVVVYQRRLVLTLGATVTVTDLGRVLVLLLLLTAAMAAASMRARAMLRGLFTVQGFFCLAIAGAWWLSLGPRPRVLGRPLDLPSPYALLYDLVPGFDGIRVPSRYAMVVALMLAIAGAIAAARFLRQRTGLAMTAVLALLFIAEARAVPYVINGQDPIPGVQLPEARVYPPQEAPRVYNRVAALPRDSVVLELPLGQPDWDLRAVYYSTVHWKRIVNGYSGFFPPNYGLIALALGEPERDRALATRALRGSGATHLVVHEAAFSPAEVRQIGAWLAAARARLLTREGTDALYEVAR